jgi:GT2 family glycosyltransferase
LSTPTLSVVVVNYNAGAKLKECLSLLHSQAPTAEVFLVDNASTDGSADELEADFQQLTVIRNRANVGYARANNLALVRTTGDPILLLNPDVRVRPSAVLTATKYLNENPDVGILGARVLLPNGKLDPAARRSFKTPATYFYKMLGLTRVFPTHRAFGHYYLSFIDDSRVTEVDSVVGAFLMIRRQTLDDIGLLDERFFMYCEDEDWCWRAKQHEWRVIYHPHVIVDHDKGHSSRQAAPYMRYHWHRSLLLYHSKNIAPRYPIVANGAVYALILASMMVTSLVYAIRTTVIRIGQAAATSSLPTGHSKGSDADAESS